MNIHDSNLQRFQYLSPTSSPTKKSQLKEAELAGELTRWFRFAWSCRLNNSNKASPELHGCFFSMYREAPSVPKW